MHVDPLEALAAFLFWIVAALAFGMLIGRIFRFNDGKPSPYQQPDDEGADVVRFPSERRRSHARNGIGGAA